MIEILHHLIYIDTMLPEFLYLWYMRSIQRHAGFLPSALRLTSEFANIRALKQGLYDTLIFMESSVRTGLPRLDIGLVVNWGHHWHVESLLNATYSVASMNYGWSEQPGSSFKGTKEGKQPVSPLAIDSRYNINSLHRRIVSALFSDRKRTRIIGALQALQDGTVRGPAVYYGFHGAWG